MEMINDLVSRGLILPHVSHSFPLAEVRVRTPSQLSVYTRVSVQVKEALLAKWERKIVGGAVVDCS